jgi:Asp-tRNA(Asn)/Glu-tRNA(Gln) amidotransferase A subunit family amidase
MTPTDLCQASAVELAHLIRTKAVSPVEVTRAVLSRIERVNPVLNAFCTITAETALDTARAAEDAVLRRTPLAPLHGVPFSTKDVHFTRGVRTIADETI